MQDIFAVVFDNLAVVISILLVLIGAVVVYVVLLVRAIIDMLRYDVHGVLLTFAFLALIPFPGSGRVVCVCLQRWVEPRWIVRSNGVNEAPLEHVLSTDNLPNSVTLTLEPGAVM